MRHRHRYSLLVGAVVATMITVPGGAWAAATSGTPATVVRILHQLDPQALAVLAQGATTAVPYDITLSGKGITVGLPFAGPGRHARRATTGVEYYDNANGSMTVPIALHDGSVRIDTILADALAPNTFRYPVTIPDGGSLTHDRDGGVDILDAHGAWLAGFSPAAAKDAGGRPVATHYVLSGDTVTQVVTTTPATTYPVLADPWLGGFMIDHVVWETVSKWSPTLAVFPTTFGRYFAPPAADGAAWSEVTAQGGRGANTPTMRTQFDCHWLAVRIYAPHKPSWDLDSKRPNTSLLNEINYKCNYPDGGEEW